jgi:tRNA nucleotidyltransferase/poly(A) polymerase
MHPKIPKEIQTIAEQFVENNYTIYLVGGCVRDLLLGKKITDWDLTTNATPEQMLQLFPDAFYNNDFGTVGIPTRIEESEHSGIVEITTFRTEKGYSDNRRPDTVSWGKTIEEDLQRRDFTINAMAFALNLHASPFTLIDPFNGKTDLERKIIRAVGEPSLRFQEDALRLMRAIRFAAQLGFTIEPKTLQAVTEASHLLEHIAQERIRDEFMKILSSQYPYEGVMLLKNTDLLTYILPELLEGINVSQTRPGRHHTTDVFTHNLLSLMVWY